MRFEFDQGIPEGCTTWLRANVGLGNIEENGSRTQQWMVDIPEYAWFFERVDKTSDIKKEMRFVPTITIKDPKKATLFALRWLS